MMNTYELRYSFVLVMYVLGSSLQINVSIREGHVVKQFTKIHIVCSSDVVPVGMAADIHINKVSNTIRLLNGQCYYTTKGMKCDPDICGCSKNGLGFSLTYTVQQTAVVYEIACSMILGLLEAYSNTVEIKVIDFASPQITTDEEFPLQVGNSVKFTCKVEGKNLTISFHWDCLYNVTETAMDNIYNYKSVITRKVDYNYDTQTCKCTANVNGYIAVTSIQVHINKKPVLYIEESVFCNSSSLLNISCTTSTELPVYGFDLWKHSFRGTFIRYLKGNVQDRQSVLTINSCSFKDAGDYTCVSWNKFGGDVYYTNKTVNLFVKGPPLIVSATQSHEQNVTLSVRFCSVSETTPVWSKLDKPILNSTKMMQTLQKRTFRVMVYNTTIDCDGYVANLTLYSAIEGHILVRLKNDFGESRKTFIVDLMKSKGLKVLFDLRNIIIGITAIGMFIVTASVTAALMKGRHVNSVVHVVGPHELSSVPVYHSAPSSEPVLHIYDTVNSGYLEVIDDSYLQSRESESDVKGSEEGSSNTTNTAHLYEDIN